MKLFAAILLCSLIWEVPAQELEIETSNATLKFIFGEDRTKGEMENIEAKISLNPLDLKQSSISGRVAVSSLNTGNVSRDKHLKSEDYFDTKKHPYMYFNSNQIEKSGDNYTIIGNLKIKDTELETTFLMKLKDDQIVFSTKINASDFDVSPKKNREKSEVTIEIILPF